MQNDTKVTWIKSQYIQEPSGEVSLDLAVPLDQLDVGEVGGQLLQDFCLFLEDTGGLK